MSPELIGILSVGAVLAALELSGRLTMDQRTVRVEGLLVGLGLSGRIDASPAGD